MRSRSGWIAAGMALVGAAVYRLAVWRRARDRVRSEPSAEPAGRADELRRKLDESRSLTTERDEFEAGEMTVDRAEPTPPRPAPALEDEIHQRRREIHGEAHEHVEAMRGAASQSPAEGTQAAPRQAATEEDEGPIHEA